MILVDDHCHLTHELYKKDFATMLENAKKAGVKAIIASGVNTKSNREVLALAKEHAPFIRCSLGIYPIDALGLGEGDSGMPRQVEPIDLDAELKFIAEHKDEIAAVGEVGLDYHWIKDPEIHKKMRDNFETIIKATEKMKKPIVLHTRKAELDCIDMIESSTIKKVVLHCFEGRKHLIKRAADNGYYFSVPAIIDKLQHFQTLVSMVSVNQLLTETDGPWLSPVKGERNNPENVRYVIQHIARIKEFTEEEAANNIWLNFQNVYG